MRPGEIFGFLGANGAGKTTAIRMLCGLLPPSGGEATGRRAAASAATPAALKRRIGYMSQRFSLYDDLTVLENLEFFGGVYGLGRASAGGAGRRAAAAAGPRRRSAAALTGSLPLGYKQRLALGCALLHEPQVLFLDEPTGGVDPVARRGFWDLIYEQAAAGVTVFVTTHYMDEAEYCGRVSIMVQGRIVALDTPAGLKARDRRRRHAGRLPEAGGRMKRILAIARKEFLHILRDRRSLAVAVLMPLAMVLIYGAVIDMELRDLKVGVLDLDRSDRSRELVRAMTSSGFIVEAERLHGRDEIEPGFRQGRFLAALVVPRGYGEDLARGAARVQVLVDGADASTAATVANYLQAVVALVNRDLLREAGLAAALRRAHARLVQPRAGQRALRGAGPGGPGADDDLRAADQHRHHAREGDRHPRADPDHAGDAGAGDRRARCCPTWRSAPWTAR